MPGIHTTIDPVLLGDERIGSVATITIDNPDRRNAMTAAMYRAMPDACAVALAEPDLRVVVLRGAGDLAFSAGSDITEFEDRRMGGEAEGYDRAEHAAWEAIESIPVPVIAAIRGSCRGGGVAIALHADLRIAADDATFSVPPANLGLSYPPEATRRLVATVGPSQAKRLLFTAEAIDAPRAERIGLVDEVVPAANHTDHVAAMVDTIAHRAPLTHRASKRVIDAVIVHGTAADIPLSELAPEAAEARPPARRRTTSAKASARLRKSVRPAFVGPELHPRGPLMPYELHTIVSGPPAGDSNAVVVWIHGVDSDASVWDPAIELVSASHRCVAVDLLGHGASPVSNDEGDYRREPVLADIDAVLDGVRAESPGAPIVWVGHSLGGYLDWPTR